MERNQDTGLVDRRRDSASFLRRFGHACLAGHSSSSPYKATFIRRDRSVARKGARGVETERPSK